MKDFILPSVIFALWIVGIAIDIYIQNKKKLQSMSDEELIMAMNFEGRFDNKFRKEYARRHPCGALAE